MRTVQIAIGCIALLLALCIWAGSNRLTTVTAADGTKMEVNISAIESLLKKDAKTGNGTSSIAERVGRMREIDISECPSDLRAAYVAHIHGWETMAGVEQHVLAFKQDREGSGDVVEGFVRGFLGDPLGKANEIRDAQTQLQRDYEAARQEIKQTWDQVEVLAVRYGARLPK